MRTLIATLVLAAGISYSTPACAPGDQIFGSGVSGQNPLSNYIVQGGNLQNDTFACTLDGATFTTFSAFGVTVDGTLPLSLILGPETGGNTIDLMTDVPLGDDIDFSITWTPVNNMTLVVDPVSSALLTQYWTNPYGQSESWFQYATADQVSFPLASGNIIHVDVAGVNPTVPTVTPEPSSWILTASGAALILIGRNYRSRRHRHRHETKS